MSGFKRFLSILLLFAVLLALVFLPKYMDAFLTRPDYIDWFAPKRESFCGTITVWHVVRFRPYLGSLGAWLEKRTEPLEKRHFGVYFKTESISEEEAAVRIANGEFPDVISFPSELLTGGELMPIGEEYPVDTRFAEISGRTAALPYALSCELILYYPDDVDAEALLDDPLAAREYSLDGFKRGKAPCCVSDARGAGDMMRLLASNKVRSFEVLPFENRIRLVQFIGISAGCAGEKLPYIRELLAEVTGESAQTALSEIGLMPLNPKAEPKFEQSFLEEAYKMLLDGAGASDVFEKE